MTLRLVHVYGYKKHRVKKVVVLFIIDVEWRFVHLLK